MATIKIFSKTLLYSFSINRVNVEINLTAKCNFAEILTYNRVVTDSERKVVEDYPNPFNPSTVIKYALLFESNVNIEFYNSLGQIVREFNEGNRHPGNYEVNFNSSGLASGIYFYSIIAASTGISGYFLIHYNCLGYPVMDGPAIGINKKLYESKSSFQKRSAISK
jgi:hypothetical protein